MTDDEENITMDDVIEGAEKDTANTVTCNLEWPHMALLAKEKMMKSLINLENRIDANANNKQEVTEDETKYTEPRTF